jgi:hypothetical protein
MNQKDLALKLLDYHGGQSSALYAIGSCMLSDAERGKVYTPSNHHGHANAIQGAIDELRPFGPDQEALALVGHLKTIAGAPKLDAFTLAYIAAALFTSTDETNEQGGAPLDRNFSERDIAPEALTQIQADCLRFQVEHGGALGRAYAQGYEVSTAGHDFWLTRNRHGAGYWDRDLDQAGRDLTQAAHAFGECSLYVGDDGQLHLA